MTEINLGVHKGEYERLVIARDKNANWFVRGDVYSSTQVDGTMNYKCGTHLAGPMSLEGAVYFVREYTKKND